MSQLNLANLKKMMYYWKRNGLSATWHAARERLSNVAQPPYRYEEPTPDQLQQQRDLPPDFTQKISIVVPTYRTKEVYLRELIDAMRGQTYPHWELLLADSTEDDRVRCVVETYEDERICYVRLAQNAGISENTNRAIERATGSFIGLLDHDDVLTFDALYTVAKAIEAQRAKGREPAFLYSDEDKCNADRSRYYEPNRKEDFNLDLLLSNHYICHFLVMRSDLLKALGLRKEYDGAQDYDLVLRAVSALMKNGQAQFASDIVHIPRVLYHWRCHEGSTAQNPQSKTYAYLAGRRALQDFVDRHHWGGKVSDLKHLGFYRIDYQDSVFADRPDLGAIGGKVLSDGQGAGKKRGSIIGGRYDAQGNVYYEGLPKGYSGYLHRAVLQQDAEALDLRCIRVRQECLELFEKSVGVAYVEGTDGAFAIETLPDHADVRALSVRFGEALRRAGYRMLWDPAWVRESS